MLNEPPALRSRVKSTRVVPLVLPSACSRTVSAETPIYGDATPNGVLDAATRPSTRKSSPSAAVSALMSRTFAPLTLPVNRTPPVGFASPHEAQTAARVAMAMAAAKRVRMCGVLEWGLRHAGRTVLRQNHPRRCGDAPRVWSPTSTRLLEPATPTEAGRTSVLFSRLPSCPFSLLLIATTGVNR